MTKTAKQILTSLDKGEYLDKGGVDQALKELEAINQQEIAKARIDELSHIGVDDDEIIVCYFTQENPDCSKDLSIGDRIAELEAEL